MPINNPPPQPISNYQGFSSCTNNQIQLKGNTAATFSKANPNRAYALIMNNDTTPITIILGGTTNAASNQGITLNPSGSYEITAQNLYAGQITALASQDAKLSFVECNW